MTDRMHFARVAAAVTLYMAMTGATHAAHIWYQGPDKSFNCMKMDPRSTQDPDNRITEFWVFFNVADHTGEDPNRPPMVLGDNGPWHWELIEVNPFGELMPHVGMRFYVDADGVGAGPEGAIFLHPTVDVETDEPLITEYWLDNNGWHQIEMAPVMYDVDVPDDVVDQGPTAVYKFVWDSFWIDYPAGDINRDGCVDQADLGELLAAYGSTPGDDHWSPYADVNFDGFVDQADLGIVLADWGQNC